MNRFLKSAAALGLCLLLSGCSSEGGVFVQSVEHLSAIGGIAPGDRFSCMVVSDRVTEVQKDTEKSVAELMVHEGDDVAEGDSLFSYDTDELQLSLDKLVLERDQLSANIENFQQQIGQLEYDRSNADYRQRLQYTIQIQSTQVDLKEAQINLKSKQTQVEKAQTLLENSTVTSPISGRIQSINENGTDSNGNRIAYIIIQQAGAYRIKGVLNELQRGAISVGERVLLTARTDARQSWSGTVTLVDYENPISSNNSNNYGMATDEMTASSKYPFYVELDTTDGLMMGQHLYLQKDPGEVGSGLQLDASFVCTDENGNSYVWAEHSGKLEKRTVTLGEYNPERNSYPIESGLTLQDYIAFPDEAVCTAGARTTRVKPETRQEETVSEA